MRSSSVRAVALHLADLALLALEFAWSVAQRLLAALDAPRRAARALSSRCSRRRSERLSLAALLAQLALRLVAVRERGLLGVDVGLRARVSASSTMRRASSCARSATLPALILTKR